MLKRTAMVVVAWTFFAAPAAAQYSGPRQLDTTTNAIWGELGFFAGEAGVVAGGIPVVIADVTIFRPLIRGYIGVGQLEIDYAWGFAFSDVDAGAAGDDSGFALGNPQAGLRFKVEQREWIMRIGGGIALPVADADDSLEAFALFGAAAIRGLWDAWLWADQRFTLIVPSFRMDSKNADFVWALEAAMGVMVDTSDAERDTEVPLQIAAEGGARLGRAFVIGGRFQTVFSLTAEDEEDAAQLAIEPFVRVEGERGFGFARMTINLDEPLGFAFDDDGVWGIHVGGGARF